MTFTLTELALLCWAAVATGLWLDSRKNLTHHRLMTGELLKRLAYGKLRIVAEGDEIKIKEVA